MGVLTQPLELVLVGGGEHARVVAEAARTRPDLWRLVGFVDPEPCEQTARLLSLPRLGDDEDAFAPGREAALFAFGMAGVGVSRQRQRVVERYAARGATAWATVVHERAWVSPTARLASGVFVAAGAVVNAGARIGEHAIVNTGAVVEHDVELGPFVQAGPGVAIGGGASIGAGSYLGLGCRVRDHVSLGRDVLVGMGAVVVADIPGGETVLGVPARARRSQR